MLARFNEIIPNGADRIVAMAESQQRHRQALEASVVSGNVKAQSRGQWFGFILGLVGIGGGIGLIAFDKSTQGLVAVVGSIAGLATVFVLGKVEQMKERARKRQELREASMQPRLPLEDQ